VGRKTANVVRGNAFDIPALAVDTHVFRVTQRLGLARSGDPDEIHDQLCAIIPEPMWTDATHLFITHGRRTCAARTPDCPRCVIAALCPWSGKVTAGTGKAPRPSRK
jgi:endonuclease-3